MGKILEAFLMLLALIGLLPDCAGAAALDARLLEKVQTGGVLISPPERPYVLPLGDAPLLPRVEACVNGKGPFHLVVDFGSNVLLLNRVIANAAHIEILVVREGTDIGEFAHGVEAGGRLYRGFPVFIHPGADRPWFGMSLLRHCWLDPDPAAERARRDCGYSGGSEEPGISPPRGMRFAF